MENTFKNIYIILILFVIFDICRNKTVKKTGKTVEEMDYDDAINQYIEEAIIKIYKFDVESVKNLVEIANNFYKDNYLELPGNVKINGTFNYLPKGCVMPYKPPDPDNIAAPEGWAICDGANNTPNLKGRFIIGYGAGYNVGNTGGASHVALNYKHNPSHKHGGGHNDHSHNYTVYYNHDNNNRFGKNDKASSKFGHRYEIWQDTTNSGNHIHSTNGSGQAHENRPPYYTLVYIIKL